MRDRDVREALRKKVFADHIRDPGTLVVEELGLSYGMARVDIAVVNGFFHGFEIKSDSDTLQRLPAQIEVYSAIFDRVTIVAGSKHIEHVEDLVPDWWGVKSACKGARGAVHFRELRRPQINSRICTVELASLLWRSEAVKSLEVRGVKGVKSKSRPKLCELLAAHLSLDELRDEVRKALKIREGWRSGTPRVTYDD